LTLLNETVGEGRDDPGGSAGKKSSRTAIKAAIAFAVCIVLPLAIGISAIGMVGAWRIILFAIFVQAVDSPRLPGVVKSDGGFGGSVLTHALLAKRKMQELTKTASPYRRRLQPAVPV
jgi:hypothetical protein